MNHDLFAFIVDFSGASISEVNSQARLIEDLGVDGDDGVELINAYSKKFSVNISKFLAAEYFNPEGDIILPAIMRLCTGKTRPNVKILTIAHLEKGILAGELNEEVINY